MTRRLSGRFEKSAGLGHIDSMGKLGDIYALAEGVEQDYQTALQWYKKAAVLGDELSLRNIESINDYLKNK